MVTQPKKITSVGLGQHRSPRTPFSQAHKFLYDLENEATFTAILEVSQQLIEACTHVGGVFCFGCDLWDETGLSWEMVSDLNPEGNQAFFWFCGACELSHHNKDSKELNDSDEFNQKREEEMSQEDKKATVNFKKDKKEKEETDFSNVDLEVNISTPTPNVPLKTTHEKSAKYNITSNDENIANLTDTPFKKPKNK